jgi:hypothetical protein
MSFSLECRDLQTACCAILHTSLASDATDAGLKREKPTRCNNWMFIINFYLNMFRASLYPSSGEERTCYCIWCVVLVLLDVVGSGCGAL